MDWSVPAIVLSRSSRTGGFWTTATFVDMVFYFPSHFGSETSTVHRHRPPVNPASLLARVAAAERAVDEEPSRSAHLPRCAFVGAPPTAGSLLRGDSNNELAWAFKSRGAFERLELLLYFGPGGFARYFVEA